MNPLNLDQDGQPYAPVNAAQNTCKSINELCGLIGGILADHVLTTDEIMFLADWLSRCNNLLHEWPASVIAGKVAHILDDGEITELEALELKELLSKIIGGEPAGVNLQPRATRLPVDDSPTPIEFLDHSFCFTGKFQYGDRKVCQAVTTERGGHIHKTVTRGLDYLVIGTLASRDWAHTNHGRKIESAVDNKRRLGARTFIVSEEQWAASLSAS
jgi:hypothetical protein